MLVWAIVNTPHPPMCAPDAGTLRAGRGESEQIRAVPREERNGGSGRSGEISCGNAAMLSGDGSDEADCEPEDGLKVVLRRAGSGNSGSFAGGLGGIAYTALLGAATVAASRRADTDRAGG